MDITGASAIVTGGASGLGEATARRLADSGAHVVILDLQEDRGEALAKEIGGVFAKADVSNEEQVQAMFKQMVDAYGTIDILVNNAGLQRDAAFQDMTLQQWNTVIGINLTGQFLCAREAVREFLRRGMKPDISSALGKIVCMSSVHEVIPWGGHVNYASSKGGIMQLMKSMAQELAPKKIRVNSVGPGAIKTPINRSAWDTPAALAQLVTLIPDGRAGEPEDIARAVIWLASDASDYVTGQTLFVDGGMTLYPGFATGG
jgi:glucose 1-dehydrogenase